MLHQDSESLPPGRESWSETAGRGLRACAGELLLSREVCGFANVDLP